MKKYPDVLYPTIVAGEIWGPVRCESIDGGEIYLETPDPVTVFNNFKPFVHTDGKTYQVTHLQFKSPKGWIQTDPQCFHAWRMFRMKKQDANGGWIPGSELGIYFRKPFSWRWDVAGTVADGLLRHFIWTKGYIGGHFD